MLHWILFISYDSHKKVIIFTHLKIFGLVTDTDCAIGETVAGAGLVTDTDCAIGETVAGTGPYVQ